MERQTFGSWFESVADRGDAIGEMAARWVALEGVRPRWYATQKVTGYLVGHAPDWDMTEGQVAQIMAAAKAEFDGTRPPYDPAAAAEGAAEDRAAHEQAWKDSGYGRKAAPALEDLPAADPGQRADGLLTGDSEADLDSAFRAATGREPPPRSQFDTEAAFAKVFERLDGLVSGVLWLTEWARAHEEALAPLREVIAEIAEADAADEEANGTLDTGGGEASLLANLNGQPAPAQPGPADLYGSFAQGRPPDWEQAYGIARPGGDQPLPESGP